MKLLINIFLLFGLVTINAQDQINAMKVPGNISKIGPQSKAWLSAEYTEVIIYPHTIIKKTNIDENIVKDNEKAKKVRVKALYDGENLSLLVEWKDTTKNIQEDCCTKARPDGFALQFPVVYNDVAKLPYISMGSKNRAVILHLKQAVEENNDVYFRTMQEYFETHHKPIEEQVQSDYGRIFNAQGYTLVKEIKDDNDFTVMEMIYKDGTWKGTVSKPLNTGYLDLTNGAFPLSIVIWDGNSSSTERVEYISSWIGVKLFGKTDGDELLDMLKIQVEGDIENGKKLVMENCVACHNFAHSITAPVNMAPNLSNIGGYSTAQYLMESIIEPSAVLTPGYNPNTQPDFPWYTTNEVGNHISTMPSYEWMDETSRNDLIAFLQSLKADIE